MNGNILLLPFIKHRLPKSLHHKRSITYRKVQKKLSKSSSENAEKVSIKFYDFHRFLLQRETKNKERGGKC